MGRRRWREQFSPSLAKISGSDNKKNARKTICTISNGKTPRLNCPGGRALLTQMLSPVLTGKLIAKKNREQERPKEDNALSSLGESKQLADSVFYYYDFIQISFFIGCCVYSGKLAHKDTTNVYSYKLPELFSPFKLIPFNLIYWFVASDMLLFQSNNGPLSVTGAPVFFFSNKIQNHFNFQKVSKPCP